MNSLPKGWGESTLGNLAEYVTSGSRDWSKYYSDSGALFVRTQDINQNKLCDLTKIARVALPQKVEGKRSLILKNDLLVTITGANVGRCAHVTEEIPEAYVSQSVALIRLEEPELARYLHAQLLAPSSNTLSSWLEENAYGMGRPVLSLENIRQVPIRIAPLPEQRRIADKLDATLARVDACRDRLARITPLLKRFRLSVLAAATSGRLTEDWRAALSPDEAQRNPGAATSAGVPSWTYERAADVCSKVQSGGTPKEGFTDKGIPFLKVYNIVDQEISFDYKPQYITSAIHSSSMSKSQVMPGDVLMNIVGPPLGKVAIVPSTHPEWNINQAITLFRPSGKITSGWLYCILCGGENIADVLHQTKGSVGQVNISLSQCRNFVFPIPPLEEQHQIVRRVETLFAFADRLEARLATAQTAADRLTPALLAKAFRGELVPQDPKDEPASALLQRLAAQRASEPKPKRGRKAAS